MSTRAATDSDNRGASDTTLHAAQTIQRLTHKNDVQKGLCQCTATAVRTDHNGRDGHVPFLATSVAVVVAIAGAVFDTLVFVGGAIHGSVTVAAAVVGTTVTEVTSRSSVTALQLQKTINSDTRNDPPT